MSMRCAKPDIGLKATGGLDKLTDSALYVQVGTPAMRPVSAKPGQSARLGSFPRVASLHHRYDWQPAA
jgi:hypothetical protein